ncbi:P-loop NTPase [Streptomyces sp. EWL5.16]|uniref:P-loop NTPase n=1 Tax=Streptomyces sp. EWL5.16 TaxID=3461011 RepID=UPI00404172C7
MEIVKALAGGYTDARVMLCDIAQTPVGDGDDVLNGQYILKAGFSTGRPQADAHNAFVEGLEEYGRSHVPQLVQSLQESGTGVDVYDIAGFSLDRLRSAEHVDAEDREETCARASRELLTAQLAVAGPPDYQGTVGSVLREWLGDAFPDDQRGSRVREVLDHMRATGRVFRHEGELLPNPLVLFDPHVGLAEQALACFRGHTHGDLHLRNVLVRGSRLTKDLTYWLIDVNWYTPTPLLYDHAYLELSALLFGLGHSTIGRVLPLLARLDEQILTVPVELDINDSGLISLLRRIRTETRNVLAAREQKREDVWQQQMLMARIAAGLNWAAKPLDDMSLRRAALASAGWAARLLLRDRHAKVWVEMAKEDPIGTVGLATSSSATPVTAEKALRLWKPFRQTHSAMDLFLVADSVTAKPELAALAHCGWAAVIDLDPDSDDIGLSSLVAPDLAERRHVSVFGENRELVSPDNATNWLMANGWASHDELSADSDDLWRRRGHLKRVRELVDATHDGTPNQSAVVLVLRSGGRDRQIDRVLDYIDERYEGIAEKLELAQAPAVNGIDIDAFLTVVAESLPPDGTAASPSLPGLDGKRWVLKWSDLQRLSVDLEVLHSEILSGGEPAQQTADEFWRGRPPTWQELEVPVDVRRDTYDALESDITQRLTDHQLATVRLDHSPGAGGTTLARRVAWNLHRSYPTVLLRTYSDTTADRIDEIYQETGYPALVIAESAILPDYDRDELVQALAQRNTRAVLLWVNRTNARHSGKHQHRLLDPLRGAERDRFLRKFRERADTDRARRLLDSLSGGAADEVAAQKLSPFYFGLCVYEDQFEGIAPYVRNHFSKLTRVQKELARHLALLTRYGQELGLPIVMVESWMGRERPVYSPLTNAELSELLGPDLRHLVVAERGALRLLHPLIAEYVLKEELDGEQYSLGKISVDFIRRTTTLLGPDNRTTAHLLNELFIRRTNMARDGQKPDNFSELIESMSTEAGAEVFEVLTTECPNNAHFWNHRGRFVIYKVRSDFGAAENFVLTAVEKSKGRDATHLHTLGMVRRFWIENTLERMLRDDERHTPEELLASVEPLFDRAMEAFTDAARYKNTDYTWSTPIQLIATVVERLWKASGDASLAEFMEGDAPSAVWVTEQIGRAEELLDNLRNINAEGDYYKRLDKQLTLLYGDVERLVEQWQELRRRGTANPETDLAIARTLYAKAGRDWSQLTEDHVRTIAQMAEEPVNSGRATDADLRLWFQSYRRLPEYSETHALERLAWFASERNSLDANYYLYILHFLIWYRGDAQDEEGIRYYLEESTRLSRAHRRQWSFEWLGGQSRPHPLVHFSEMGRQRHGSTGFWSHPQELVRVQGIIQEIKSPQSGRLRIRRSRLPAFFTPRNRFRKTRDIEAPVEFYLGFSYEGLRAWEPTYPGETPDALINAEPPRTLPVLGASSPALSVPAPADTRETSEPDPKSLQGREPAAAVSASPVPGPYRVDPAVLRSLTARRRVNGEPPDFRGAVLDLVQQARGEERPLTSLELGKTLQTLFGMDAYKRFLKETGKGKLKLAVQTLGFRTSPTPQGFDVDLP